MRRRGKSSWTFAVEHPRGPDGKRRQVWITVHGSRRKAELERERLRAEARNQPPDHDARLTLAEYLDRWMTYQKPRITPRTWEQYESILRRHVLPGIGDVPIAKLRPLVLQQFYAGRLTAGLTAASVRQVHRVLAAALHQAERWELITRSAASLVSPPPVRRIERKPLGAEESARFLEAAKDHPDYALILLAVATGLRRGELFALRWEDLDLARGSLTVAGSVETSRQGSRIKEPKTERSRRIIALPPFAIVALAHHRARQAETRLALADVWQDNGMIFPGPGGKLASVRSFDTRWRQLRIALGFPHLRFHDLRHGHGSQLLSAGVPLPAVSARLGHSSPAITAAVYAHQLPGDDERAAAVTEQLLRGRV